MKENKTIQIAVTLSLLIGFFAGIIGSFVGASLVEPSEEDLIEEFYKVETAAHVSPHGLRKHMGEGDDTFVLVDLRSAEEYETEHVTGAINIPAYATPDKSAYGDVERIVGSFKELQAENPEKDIIVYCYSVPCMTGRKIGKMLTEHGIYVKHLGVGWNEWKYYWDLWNHDGETKVNPELYTTSGPEPGEIKGVKKSTTCGIEGEFGC